MDRKTKIYILIFAIIIAAGVGYYFFAQSASGGTVAVISVDGREYSRIDLSRVKESYELVIETEYGKNVLLVEPGSICVSEADCPDQVCIKMGRLTDGGLPVICMPHRLIISIEGSELDA